MTDTADAPLLEIKNLCLSYYTRAGEVPAVVDFSLTLHAGESVGLVGESGCGKSTVAMAIMQYMGSNGGIVGGTIKFKGRDLSKMSPEELRDIRGSEIAMIYQEPMASLNPAMKIGKQLMEVPMIHQGISKEESKQRTISEIPAQRLGTPDEFGALCAFLCSTHAGYLTGKNYIVDGGLNKSAF